MSDMDIDVEDIAMEDDVIFESILKNKTEPRNRGLTGLTV